MEQFVLRFLENSGALLERENSGFEALLPAELSQLLGIPEHVRIRSGSADDQMGHYTIGYGSRLLEEIVNTACGKVPVAACRFVFDYLKRQGFDRLISEQFVFDRSVGKIVSFGNVMTNYVFLSCQYVAQSDEQKQGLIGLVFSYETGALIPNMEDMLSVTEKDFTTPSKPFWDGKKLKAIMEGIKKHSEKIISEDIQPFEESMSRRFKRDAANLEEYYGSLKKEMEKSLERPGLSDELVGDRRAKIALLPDELATKRDDLFKKYSIRVKVIPCAAMFITTPAVKILYEVRAGKDRKNLSLIYNPVTRAIDPLPCEGCGRSITRIYFSNGFHALCSRCDGKRNMRS